MTKTSHEKALKNARAQGFSTFETIKLLAHKAKEKQRAVKGIKYLSPEQQDWHRAQDKFTIQAVKELDDGTLDLNEYNKEITTPVEEETQEPIEDQKE